MFNVSDNLYINYKLPYDTKGIPLLLDTFFYVRIVYPHFDKVCFMLNKQFKNSSYVNACRNHKVATLVFKNCLRHDSDRKKTIFIMKP